MSPEISCTPQNPTFPEASQAVPELLGPCSAPLHPGLALRNGAPGSWKGILAFGKGLLALGNGFLVLGNGLLVIGMGSWPLGMDSWLFGTGFWFLESAPGPWEWALGSWEWAPGPWQRAPGPWEQVPGSWKGFLVLGNGVLALSHPSPLGNRLHPWLSALPHLPWRAHLQHCGVGKICHLPQLLGGCPGAVPTVLLPVGTSPVSSLEPTELFLFHKET